MIRLLGPRAGARHRDRDHRPAAGREAARGAVQRLRAPAADARAEASCGPIGRALDPDWVEYDLRPDRAARAGGRRGRSGGRGVGARERAPPAGRRAETSAAAARGPRLFAFDPWSGLFALSLADQVEKYGAYAGIAAFFGLAVLSLLYFAQAREVQAPARMGGPRTRACARDRGARDRPGRGGAPPGAACAPPDPAADRRRGARGRRAAADGQPADRGGRRPLRRGRGRRGRRHPARHGGGCGRQRHAAAGRRARGSRPSAQEAPASPNGEAKEPADAAKVAGAAAAGAAAAKSAEGAKPDSEGATAGDAKPPAEGESQPLRRRIR